MTMQAYIDWQLIREAIIAGVVLLLGIMLGIYLSLMLYMGANPIGRRRRRRPKLVLWNKPEAPEEKTIEPREKASGEPEYQEDSRP